MKKWYLQSWFLCLVFAFSVTGIALVIGLILLVMSMLEDRKIKELLMKAGDIRDYDDKLKYMEFSYREKEDNLKKSIEYLKEEKSEINADIEALNKEHFVSVVSTAEYKDYKSDEIKNELSILKTQQEDAVRGGRAVLGLAQYPDAKSRRQAEIQKKQILRCFNTECSNIISGISVKNIDTTRSKIERSYDALNKLFDSDGVLISREYLSLKLKEMSLVNNYMLKLEEEKEQKKLIREQMAEEEKVRREIEREKQKIEKEERQFSAEMNRLMGYLNKAKSDVEKELYIDKIRELEEKLAALQKDKENVLERESNTRAGFVYVISNIGSLGENVYKIGMTRRLEPMDRISELSSASVPFSFDVHAMIFSEDAPRLENILHQTFREYEVNKVNHRKEFFKVDLNEIRKIVNEQHNATVQFIDEPDALEYRETLRMESDNTAEPALV